MSERYTNVAGSLRVLFAGGGTGGHLFPALAIADEVRTYVPDAEILFVGTKDKIEARVVPEKGYRLETIWISGFRRNFALGNLVFPLKVMVSVMQAFSIIRKFQPHVVVGTGGYVSGPVLYAASRKNIPTLIQEQNSYPGATTRMLAKRATEVHITFESSRKYFDRKDNLFLSGNPTRAGLENVYRSAAVRYFGFTDDGRKTVLVFGGSLGAHSINRAVEQSFDQIVKHNLRLIWQTGTADLERMKPLRERVSHDSVWIDSFIDRMDFAYAASDMVVCRAGATTIAELARLGKAAILVPYPFAAANHQAENARAMAEAGAAVIVNDADIEKQLASVLSSALDENNLGRMREASKNLGWPNAAKTIAERIVDLSKNSNLRHAN